MRSNQLSYSPEVVCIMPQIGSVCQISRNSTASLSTMRHFNRGYALVFTLVLIAALLGMRWTYQLAAPYVATKTEKMATYTIDDWISFFKLDDMLGEPDITPVPADQYPFTITPQPTKIQTPKPTLTPSPES